MPTHTVKIGTTYGGLALLSTYNIPDPDFISPATPYAKTVNLASGKTLGQGVRMAYWRWEVLHSDKRQLLYAIVGMSADVFIETPNQFYDNEECTAIAHWPAEPRMTRAHLPAFELMFTNILAYTP